MRIISRCDITELENVALKDGVLQVLPYDVYKKFTNDQISLFCLKNGFYCLPTTELIEFLKTGIGDLQNETIEIGAGCGVVGRELGITMTDSFMQERPEIKLLYNIQGQSTITYGQDVKRFDAAQAVEHFKPTIVIAAWVTQIWKDEDCIEGESKANVYGIDENIILDKVNTYVHIGNINIHGTKRILNYEHNIIDSVPLISRSGNNDDIIYIWERKC